MEYVLITGASTGIGFATSQYLLDKGYFVFGSVRKLVDADRLQQTFGANFQPLVFDVCDQEAISKSLTVVENICGKNGLKALINNAGIAVSGAWQFVEIEQIQHQMDVNFYGVIRVTQTFLPLLGATKNAPIPPGKIINISSVSGLFSNPFLGPYCASKFALESFSDSLRRELLVYGIDVILLEPGPVKTEIWGKALAEKLSYPGTAYEKVLEGYDEIIKKNEKEAIDVDIISKHIHQVISQTNPKTRYILIKNKFFFKLATYLPDRLVDYFVKRNFQKMGAIE